jgi:hypothetical protein
MKVVIVPGEKSRATDKLPTPLLPRKVLRGGFEVR